MYVVGEVRVVVIADLCVRLDSKSLVQEELRRERVERERDIDFFFLLPSSSPCLSE